MVAPLLIDYDDFTAIAHTTTTESGGKGGSVKSSNTTYTYTVMAIMALGEGVLSGTGNIWEGSKTTSASALGLTFFNGDKGGLCHFDYETKTKSTIGTLTVNMPSDTYSITNIYVEPLDSSPGYYLSDYTFNASNMVITLPRKVILRICLITYVARDEIIDVAGQLPWGYLLPKHP